MGDSLDESSAFWGIRLFSQAGREGSLLGLRNNVKGDVAYASAGGYKTRLFFLLSAPFGLLSGLCGDNEQSVAHMMPVG